MQAMLKALKHTAIVAVFILGGCAAFEEEAKEPMPADEGYQWVGAGEPTNFGADYGYCRRQEVRTSVTPIDRYQTGSLQQARANDANIRRFRSCMLGRGWQSV
jgi:hypothetical protein